MSVPKKRRTSGSRKRRASHFALSTTSILACPNCKKPVRPHHACPSCGTYKGKSLKDSPATIKAEMESKKKTPEKKSPEPKKQKSKEKPTKSEADKK